MYCSRAPERTVCRFLHCVMNYHTRGRLKQHAFILSPFLWLRSPGTAPWPLCSGSRQAVVSVGAGLWVIGGSGSSPKLT